MFKLPNIIIKLLMPFMSKMTPACEVISQKISESMDNKISPIDRIKIRIHLLGCKFCQRYEKQLIMMQKMIEKRTTEMDELPGGPKLSNELRQKLKLKIKESNKS
jgi:predicted anti-sigma-YlaC factor YlaD